MCSGLDDVSGAGGGASLASVLASTVARIYVAEYWDFEVPRIGRDHVQV
jgi:hypothetical protein